VAQWRRTGLDDARIRLASMPLRHEPSASNHAIRLEPDLADGKISGSAVTANALLLIRRAAETGGLKLTRDRQSVPRLGRGDVRDHGMAGVRQG
jgi:hypothetical protein